MLVKATLAAAAAMAVSGPAFAAGFTEPAEIDRAVAEFTRAAMGTPGGARMSVDRRLRLAWCPAGLALDWYGRGRSTVIVRCPEPGGWRVFVPLVDGGAEGAGGEEIVTRGSRVTISVKGSGFTLSRQGEALESGAAGEWVRVRPAEGKGDPFRAKVLHPGVVGMDLP